MKMKSKTIIYGVILLAAFAIGWLGYWHFSDNPKNEAAEPVVQELEGVPGRGFYRMATYLELDSVQWQQFRTHEEQYRISLGRLIDQSVKLEADIMAELSKLNPDRNVLNRHVAETGKLKAETRQLTIDHFLTLKSICNPEQDKKLNALFREMERGQGLRGRGQGNGQGIRHRWRRGQTAQ